MANGINAPASARNVGKVSLLPAILVVIFMAYVVLFLVLPEFVGSVADMVESVPVMYRLVGAGVLFAFFLLMILFNAFTKQTPAAPHVKQAAIPPSKPPVQTQPPAPIIQSVAKPVPPSTQPAAQPQAQTFTYPVVVEGGIYGDTFIRISEGKTLKIRSMVVEPDKVK